MKLDKNVQKKSNARMNIHVKIDKEDVQKEREKIIKDLEKNAKIQGFRKGKVPRSIILLRFSNDIKNEAMNSLFSKSIAQIIKEDKYNPVSTPSITEAGELIEDEDFSFKAEFDVMPEVELSEYKGIESNNYIYEVIDDDVDKVIDNFREQFSNLSSTDEKAEIGNYLVIDYGEKSDDGNVVKKESNKTILLDNKDNQLVKALIGTRKGEEKNIELSNEPNDKTHPSKTKLNIKVKDVKVKTLPELNDDFAKDVSDVDTLDKFRKKIKDGLLHEANIRSDNKTKAELLKKLVEKSTFEIPDTMINNEIDRILSEIAYSYKLDLDKIKKDKDKFEEYRKNLRPRAVVTIKNDLVLYKIADKEGLEVTDKETDKEIKEYALQSKRDFKSVKEDMVKNGTIENLKFRLRPEKALDFIYKNAVLKKEKRLKYSEQEGGE